MEQAARTDEVALVKKYLMKTRGLREDRAYQVIVNYKKTHGCTIEEAAHALRIQWNVKGD